MSDNLQLTVPAAKSEIDLNYHAIAQRQHITGYGVRKTPCNLPLANTVTSTIFGIYTFVIIQGYHFFGSTFAAYQFSPSIFHFVLLSATWFTPII